MYISYFKLIYQSLKYRLNLCFYSGLSLQHVFSPSRFFSNRCIFNGFASSSSWHVYLGTCTCLSPSLSLSAPPICSASVLSAQQRSENMSRRLMDQARGPHRGPKMIILSAIPSLCLHTGWPLRPNTPLWQMRKISCRYWTPRLAGVIFPWFPSAARLDDVCVTTLCLYFVWCFIFCPDQTQQ